jgi:hypothetical protein
MNSAITSEQDSNQGEIGGLININRPTSSKIRPSDTQIKNRRVGRLQSAHHRNSGKDRGSIDLK